MRARDALAKFNDALPVKIAEFGDTQVAKVASLLKAFEKNHADALPFALALVARRLKTPWQLIRLASKAAPSKNAVDIAAAPYAITVSMVLDRLDNRRTALRVALKNNRVLVAKEILTEIYDTEYALRVRIDQLDESEWGQRLDESDRRDGNPGRGGSEPVSRQCRPRAGIAQPARPSIPLRPPDLSGVEGTRCPRRRSGLLQETRQRGLKSRCRPVIAMSVERVTRSPVDGHEKARRFDRRALISCRWQRQTIPVIPVHPRKSAGSICVTWRGGFPRWSCRACCRPWLRTKASGLR